ncbi:hypothetical protein C2G38_2090130 [Gigaspora rosea]|uniref:Uncharacterized protein n=1 Tax=Gigaspora rosea TaxID=44941 RepID=A0A397V9T5_9GLOM|nr:hypothetical protein C2G38_2090130 [Gigaspora rosea]
MVTILRLDTRVNTSIDKFLYLFGNGRNKERTIFFFILRKTDILETVNFGREYCFYITNERTNERTTDIFIIYDGRKFIS